jgi:hypothetical protein
MEAVARQRLADHVFHRNADIRNAGMRFARCYRSSIGIAFASHDFENHTQISATPAFHELEL